MLILIVGIAQAKAFMLHLTVPAAPKRYKGRIATYPLLTTRRFHSRRLGIATEMTGIRLRRDSWVSVRYAEELNSGKSSVTPQRTDRHGILGEKLTDFQVSL